MGKDEPEEHFGSKSEHTREKEINFKGAVLQQRVSSFFEGSV